MEDKRIPSDRASIESVCRVGLFMAVHGLEGGGKLLMSDITKEFDGKISESVVWRSLRELEAFDFVVRTPESYRDGSGAVRVAFVYESGDFNALYDVLARIVIFRATGNKL